MEQKKSANDRITHALLACGCSPEKETYCYEHTDRKLLWFVLQIEKHFHFKERDKRTLCMLLFFEKNDEGNKDLLRFTQEIRCRQSQWSSPPTKNVHHGTL
jgi:hypothetical protein